MPRQNSYFIDSIDSVEIKQLEMGVEVENLAQIEKKSVPAGSSGSDDVPKSDQVQKQDAFSDRDEG